MVVLKSINDITRSMVNNIHDTMPNYDTKEGTFIRDVFINPTSDEVSGLYGDLKLVELAQSINTAVEDKLDRLAANYFVYRKGATRSFGKVRFYIKGTSGIMMSDANFPNEVIIPKGTIVSTQPTASNPNTYQFTTMESVHLTLEQIKLLPQDVNNGMFKYVEVPTRSVDSGTVVNVKSGAIIQQVNNLQEYIIFVFNPYAFTGGTNKEDDNSLKFRVALALLGANIGTEYGYLSYVLKQNGVIDAKVVGAGKPIMFRDGGYINEEGIYIPGKGGMVDIHVRGHISEESVQTFKVTTEYVNNNYPDITLLNQPVNDIITVHTTEGKQFINAELFGIERAANVNTDGSINNDSRYYDDIEWDFSIKNSFVDWRQYPLPDNLTESQIEKLKEELDTELKDAAEYMENLNYGLNWGLMHTINEPHGKTNFFTKYFYNNKVYKIIAHDERLGGRVFVKKNDKMYVRVYYYPDFTVVRDYSTIGGSINSNDCIRWLNGNRPLLDDELLITYNYDWLINQLQSELEGVKCLTADVLVKRAVKIPVEIMLTITVYPTYDITSVKLNCATRLTNYVNNIKKMGGEFDRSDIVAIARNTEGVDMVDIDTITISELGSGPKRIITAKDNEYLQLESIIISAYSSEQIVI